MRDLSTGTTILAVEWPGEMLMTSGGCPPVSIAGMARTAAAAGVNVASASSRNGAADFANLMKCVMEIAAGAPAPLAADLLPHKNKSPKLTNGRINVRQARALRPA